MPVDWDNYGGDKKPKKKVDWDDFGGGKSSAPKKEKGILGFGKRLITSGPANTVFKALDLPRKAAIHAVPFGLGKTADEEIRKRLPEKGAGGFLSRTGYEIATDPLTYLSFGTSAGAKQGLKVAAKELGEETAKTVAKKGTKALSTAEKAKLAGATTPKVMKKLDRGAQGGVKMAGRTLPGLGSQGKLLGKPVAAAAEAGNKLRYSKALEGITPRGGIARTRGKEAADAFGAAESSARSAASNATADTIDRIHKAAKLARVTTAELRDTVLPAIDVGGRATQVPARLAPLVDNLRSIVDETTTKQVDAGVLPGVREDYVARFLTKEAKDALGETDSFANDFGLRSQPAAIAKQAGKLKGRTNLPDAPLTQANDKLVRDLGLKGDAYEMDPLMTTAKRAALADRAVAQKRLFDDVAKITDDKGQPLIMRAEAGERPLRWETVDAGPIGQFHAPPEVAKELDKVRAVITNDESMKEFSGFMAKMNNAWKAQATVPLVGGAGFHLRNAQGNLWNNFLAGVKNPKVYLRALKLQQGKALTAADRQLLDLAKQHGVIDEGFFLHDLMDPAAAGNKLSRVAVDAKGKRLRAGLNPVSTEGWAIRSGRSVGSAVENNARLAHFIAKMDELGDATAASMSVKKYLFDYGDLTALERNTLKRWIPFYTFMRKNTPLQFANMAKQPGKLAGMAHAQNQLGEGRDRSLLPDFLLDEPYQPYNIKGETIAARLDTPVDAALEAVNPFAQSDLGAFGGFVPSLLKYAWEEKDGDSLYTGFNTKGSTPQRLAEAVAPITGKIRRAPYGPKLPTGAGIGLNSDDPEQFLARLIASLTGARTYRTDAE